MATSPFRFALAAAAVLLLVGCADRPRRNPLDAGASQPLPLAVGLRALAGDGQVELRWDFSRFEDVTAVRLHRESGDSTVVREVSAADTSFVDRQVRNGEVYRYRISLDIAAEGELRIAGEHLATPGPERVWVIDASGLVWRLTPDGRQTLFARGRFPEPRAIALDESTGDCWVADALLGLHRISVSGELTSVPTALSGAGALVIDSEARSGWVAEAGGRSVFGFSLDTGAEADTLELVELDGTFADSVALSADGGGGVWIGDRGQDRVVRNDAQGRRIGEWRSLPGLVDVDATADRCCSAWALIGDGDRLQLLTADGLDTEVEVPFAGARLADVAPSTGELWVTGDTDIAAFLGDGSPVLHWSDVAGGRGLEADGVNEQLWVAGVAELSKFSLEGLTYQARLTGFTSIIQIAVDPGR